MLEIVKVEFDIAKENLINEILKSDLSEYEKMEMIDQYNLYEILDYVYDPFSEEYEKYLAKLNDNPVTDDFFTIDDCIRRGSVVKPYEYCEYIDDNNYTYNKEGDNMITIYTNRRNDIVHKISSDEFKRLVYKWHHDNKAIGFTYDW